MDLDNLQRNWDVLGREDPMWAILSNPAKHGNRWDKESFFQTGRGHVDELMRELDRLGVGSGHARALDFGCGIGRLAQALADAYDRVDGVDIAQSMIEGAEACNRHGERVSYHVNRRDDLTLFADGTFDLVLSLIVLQHIENRYKVHYLDEFLRVLRPGGVLVFSAPSHATMTLRGMILGSVPNGILNRYRRMRYGYHGVMELHPMRRAQIELAITHAGGRVAHVAPDQLAGGAWRSFRYVVVKPP